jgi:putative phage-type endonuclease
MKLHDLLQGSPEWRAHRSNHFNASDAPAMMGVSPYKTRAELLREMHTGLVPDIDIGTQKRFDNGHRAEALARPLAEEFIGAELYPVTGSEGKLSASFDGLTLDESTGFEHKAMNAELRRAIQDEDSAPQLPIYHRVQMEQQLLISGAKRILFMASAWDDAENLLEERHCWYITDPALRAQIVDGWEQFEKDLVAYVLHDAVAPAPVGKAPETLPALHIEVTGKVTASNLAEFKETALAAIRSVNRELTTDQQFADAEKAVKWCAEVESRLDAAKQHALSQTASIDALFKAIDDISAEARTVRLDLSKLVTRRKTEVKEEAIAAARKALAQHLEALNAELGRPGFVQLPGVDFAGAIKGLRSFDSMQEALDTTLAAAKIEADAKARGVRANLATFSAHEEHRFLFADIGQLLYKAPEDFALVVQGRIDAHKLAEAEKARKALEAEAERKRKADAAAAEAATRATAAAPPTPAAPPAVAVVTPVRAFVPAPVPAPQADEPATLRLGAVCDRLGFTMTSSFIADTLHIKPAKVEGAAKLYRESDFGRICAALQLHISNLTEAIAA